MTISASTRHLGAPALAAALAIALPCAQAGQDIDIFAAGAGVTPKPNVLLVLDNSSNWSATLGPNNCFAATSDTKFHAEVCSLQTILGNPDFGANVRLGLMMFAETGENGGYIRYGIRDMTAANKTAFSSMLGGFVQSGSNSDSSSSSQPYGKVMFEAFKYFGGYTRPSLAQSDTPGSPVGKTGFGPRAYAGWSADSGSDTGAIRRDHGANTAAVRRAARFYSADANWALDDATDTEYNYNLAITDGCAKNFVIFISNGNPSIGGDSGGTAMAELMANIGVSPTSINSGGKEIHASKMDEMAKYLFNTDVSPLPGQQKVITYTIGVYLPNPQTGAISNTDQEMIKLLKSAASAGGGKYFAATNAAEVTNALLQILNEVQAVNSVFVSASLPVSVNTQGTFLNQVYMGMFRPDEKASPRWLGNLKQFKFILDPDLGELYLADAQGNRAVNPATGFITPTSASFWTQKSEFWVNNPTGTPLSESDLPDGEIVEKGGASEGLRVDFATSQNARRYYTCPASGCSGTLSFEFNTTNITGAPYQTALGAASAAELTTMVKWIRGEDNLNGDPASAGWSSAEGGPGLPTTVRPSIHGDVLHSRPVVLNYKDLGPYIFYGANDGTLRSVKGGQAETDGHESWAFVAPEFLGKFKRLREGLPQLLTPATLPGIIPAPENKDYFFDGPIGSFQDETRAWIFVAARRGGRFIYAFDVSDPTKPQFMWKVSNAELPELGETWSEPKAIMVKASADPVLIFGAGYDPVEDLDTPAGHTMGRGVYVLDAKTGALLKFFQTAANTGAISRPVASDVAVSDTDFDTFIDRAYVGDLGGYIWRLDLDGASTSDWKLFQFAKTFSTAKRKYFYQPDIVLTKDFHVVVVGSGDREKPLMTSSNDYFFGFKDTFPGKDATGMVPILRTELTKVDLGGACEAPAKGWYLPMESGEKIINSPLVIAGTTYFSTNKPVPSAPGTCTANLGRARTYSLDFVSGCPASDTNEDGVRNEQDLYVDLTGGGLPPSPVGGIVELDDGRLVGFVIGGGQSASPIEAGRVRVNIPKTRQKIYWNTKTDK